MNASRTAAECLVRFDIASETCVYANPSRWYRRAARCAGSSAWRSCIVVVRACVRVCVRACVWVGVGVWVWVCGSCGHLFQIKKPKQCCWLAADVHLGARIPSACSRWWRNDSSMARCTASSSSSPAFASRVGAALSLAALPVTAAAAALSVRASCKSLLVGGTRPAPRLAATPPPPPPPLLLLLLLLPPPSLRPPPPLAPPLLLLLLLLLPPPPSFRPPLVLVDFPALAPLADRGTAEAAPLLLPRGLPCPHVGGLLACGAPRGG